MIELLNFLKDISKESWQLIVVVILIGILLVIVFFLSKALLKSFTDKMDENTATTAIWSKQVQDQLVKVTSDLDDHKDSMGKATKAINGDFLKMRESIIEVRNDFFKDSISLKKELSDTRADLLMIGQKTQFAADALNEKNGKIIMVENNMAKVLSESKQNDENIKKVAREVGLIKKHITENKSK